MFEDRSDAGKQLAQKVLHEAENSLVIALPRGGVVVGFPIAQALRVSLEVLAVRKIGSPNNPEVGIGALAEDGIVFLDTGLTEMLQISNTTLRALEAKEMVELERRKKLYRSDEPLPLLTNKTVILVDDGLATGVTAHAALLSLKKHHPKKIIFAVPICSSETAQAIRPFVDNIICLQEVDYLDVVGKYYHDFDQISDDEVLSLLQKIHTAQRVPLSMEIDFAHKIVW